MKRYTPMSLRQPDCSYPANPLVAEPLYLAKYIERMGSGIGDMIDRCKAHGLQEPSFTLTDGFVATIWRKPDLALSNVTPQPDPSTPQVMQLLTDHWRNDPCRVAGCCGVERPQ